VWKVHPDGKLEASVEKGETQVASNGHHP
jgi:hypothetical protein